MRSALKEQFENLFAQGDFDAIKAAIADYKQQYPQDRDLWFYECAYDFTIQDYDGAKKIAQMCVRKFPTSYEAYYYQGCVFQAEDKVSEALKSYKISEFLAEYFHVGDAELLRDMKNQIRALQDVYQIQIQDAIEKGDMEQLQKISSFLQRSQVHFGKKVEAPRDVRSLLVGTECWVTDEDLRYAGIYRSPVQGFIGDENLSMVRTQAEFLKFKEKGQDFYVDGDAQNYLVPIASTEQDNVYAFIYDGQEHDIKQWSSRHFNYFKVRRDTQIMTYKDAYFGYPIPLGHSRKRRKLVLNLFVDGLAQTVLDGSGFQERMPNTYAFFRKGTICTRTYSCSEWTFPSIATYESGLNTLHHMMFHSTVDGELPKEMPTISEYFKRQGYYTSKMDGEWRSTCFYGYARGLDQYVYQVQPMGARAEQEIISVIEHIEAFQETDQYLWMYIGDLHDIADGLDLSVAVQNQLAIEDREVEDRGITSVKQDYSAGKIKMYQTTLQYLDMLFGLLYSYIERNYTDDEILISLFADHGQGYFIPSGEPMLSDPRTRVAFMFRGANVTQQITDELMSTADYMPIMCRLAGIKLDAVSIDGSLPAAFGGEEKAYVITESLHPGDVYCAVANAKDYEIFFKNTEPTDNEGRFHLGEYQVYGRYKDGTEMRDANLLSSFERIFLDRIASHIIYE